jgi:hypothetical protein
LVHLEKTFFAVGGSVTVHSARAGELGAAVLSPALCCAKREPDRSTRSSAQACPRSSACAARSSASAAYEERTCFSGAPRATAVPSRESPVHPAHQLRMEPVLEAEARGCARNTSMSPVGPTCRSAHGSPHGRRGSAASTARLRRRHRSAQRTTKPAQHRRARAKTSERSEPLASVRAALAALDCGTRGGTFRAALFGLRGRSCCRGRARACLPWRPSGTRCSRWGCRPSPGLPPA